MLPFGHSCKGSTIHCASIFWNHTRKQVKKHYTKNGQTVQIISANVANPLPVIFTLCPKNWVGTRNDGHAGCEQIASSVSVSLQLATNDDLFNVTAYSKRHCECSEAECGNLLFVSTPSLRMQRSGMWQSVLTKTPSIPG